MQTQVVFKDEKGTIISATLQLKKMGPKHYMLLDPTRDLRTLTPHNLDLQYKSLIVAEESNDGSLAFIKKTDLSELDQINASKYNLTPLKIFCGISSVFFIISVIAHFSTYSKNYSSPGEYLLLGLQIAVISLFIISVFYVLNVKEKKCFDTVSRHAPKWLFVPAVGLCVYALVNLGACCEFMKDTPANKDDNKKSSLQKSDLYIWESPYLLFSRLASGHLPAFSAYTLVFLCGVLEVKRRKIRHQDLIPEKQEKTPPKTTAKSLPPPLPVGRKRGLAALACYIVAVIIIVSGEPILNLLISPFIIYNGYKLLVRMWKRSRDNGDESSETLAGCLVLPPNFFLSVYMVRTVLTTLYIACHAGIYSAFSRQVTYIGSRHGIDKLSNGDNVAVWFETFTLIPLSFALLPFLIFGLTELMHIFGKSTTLYRKQHF